MFHVSKIAWYVLQPSHFVMALLGLGLFLAIFTRARESAKLLLLTAATIVALVVFTPLDDFALRNLENRFQKPQQLPMNIEGIMILGGGVDPAMTADRKSLSFFSSADRIVHGVILGRHYVDKPILFAGGSGDMLRQELKEADDAADALSSLGITRKRMILERQSRNTFENFLYSKDQIPASSLERPWLLVTSARHMPRAVGVAKRLGWNVIPYPVDYHTYSKISWWPTLNLTQSFTKFDMAMKEWVGLAYYYYKGYTSSLLPKDTSL